MHLSFIEGALGSRCIDWEIFLSADRRDSFNEMKCDLLRGKYKVLEYEV